MPLLQQRFLYFQKTFYFFNVAKIIDFLWYGLTWRIFAKHVLSKKDNTENIKVPNLTAQTILSIKSFKYTQEKVNKIVFKDTT